MMLSGARLDRLEKGMNAKQLALMEVHEALRHPSLLAYAAVASRPGGAQTLCRRIEDAVGSACTGLDRAGRRARLVESVREALFLVFLFRACNADFVQHARERELEAALLELELGVLVSSEGDDASDGLVNWLIAARRFVDRNQARLAAVDLLAKRYFEGTDILFPAARLEMRELTAGTADRAGVVARVLDGAGVPVKAGPAVSPRSIAQGWVDLARGEAHWAVDEDEEAFSLYAGLLRGPEAAAGVNDVGGAVAESAKGKGRAEVQPSIKRKPR